MTYIKQFNDYSVTYIKFFSHESVNYILKDHDILLQYLNNTFGISGSVYNWLTSFLLQRTQVVHFWGENSLSRLLSCGVPQSSCLGPLLFSIYVTDLYNIAANSGVGFHSYTDDIQLLVQVRQMSWRRIDDLMACVWDIDEWMFTNRLQLNPDKTQLTCFGRRQQLAKIDKKHIQMGNTDVPIGSSAPSLGVHLDSGMTMLPHIQHISKTCYYQLRQLRSGRRSLPIEIAKSLVQSLICTRIDYWNSALFGASAISIRRLQSVLNSAARFIFSRSKFDSWWTSGSGERGFWYVNA